MRQRLVVLFVIVILVTLAYSAGQARGGEKGLKYLNLPGRTDNRPYNHAIVAGETIYVAGTIGIDTATGRPPEDPGAEARLALDGMKAKLELAGAVMDDLVMVQIFCSDVSLYADFNEIYATYFEDRFPVRAFVGSGPLLMDAKFEINGIAVKR